MKRIGSKRYLHRTALDELPARDLERVQAVSAEVPGFKWSVVRLNGSQIMLGRTTSFDTDPHPALLESITFESGLQTDHRRYGTNPPIYHRIELMLPQGHPARRKAATRTKRQQAKGLLSRPDIGTRRSWMRAKGSNNSLNHTRVEGSAEMNRCRRIVDQFLYRACVDRKLAGRRPPAPREAVAEPAWSDRISELSAKQIREQNLSDNPKPSRVLSAVLDQVKDKDKQWLLGNRATALVFYRSKLNGQPQRPQTVNLDRPPIAAEAFAGGGLFTCAGRIEGIEYADVCEIEEYGALTLRENLGQTLAGQIEPQDALKWTPYVPEQGLDLLLGGPPCQPFSQGASLGRGVIGPASDKNGYPRILDWLVDAQPRVAVMENSSNIVTNERFRPYFEKWLKQARVAGYSHVTWLVYAPDFGTPQSRRRAFVVLYPTGASWGSALQTPPQPTHAPPNDTDGKLPWVSLYDRLHSGCCGGYGLIGCENLNNTGNACVSCVDGSNFYPAANQSGVEARRSPTMKTILDVSGYMKSGFNEGRPVIKSRKPAPANKQSKETFNLKTAATEYLSPTVMAGGGSQREKEALMIPRSAKGTVASLDLDDPVQLRAFVDQLELLSVREAAKIQDVPQWWVFKTRGKLKGGKFRHPKTPRKQAYIMVGNGIPVNVGRAVLRRVLDALGYNTPIPRTLASDPLSGVWPSGNKGEMLYNDGCAPFGDYPLMYPGGDPPDIYIDPMTRILSLTPEERAGFGWDGELESDLWQTDYGQRLSLERDQLWTTLGGIAEPDHDKLLRAWTPSQLGELPPGFASDVDVRALIFNQGSDPELWRQYLLKYAAVSPLLSEDEVSRADDDTLFEMAEDLTLHTEPINYDRFKLPIPD